MISLLARLKAWGWALAAGALAVGAFLLRLKVVKTQRDNAVYERDKLRYQAKQRKAVDDNLAEVDQTFSRRAALRAKEKAAEPDTVPERLRDMNDF